MITGEAARQIEIVRDVRLVAHLDALGQGKIGPKSVIPEVLRPQVLHKAGEALHRPSNPNVAFCIDGRKYLRVGNITDPAMLRRITANQLAGGTYLTATKAAVAAHSPIISGTESFVEAYNKVGSVLKAAGIEDSSHKGCGAEVMAESSMRDPLSSLAVAKSLNAVGALREDDEVCLRRLENNKRSLPVNYFEGYSPEWHQERVRAMFPNNYAELADDPNDHETHGHAEGGLLLIGEEDIGIAKNEFVDATGRQLFAATPAFGARIANVLGTSSEERELLRLAIMDDNLCVTDCLVAPAAGDYLGLAIFVV